MGRTSSPLDGSTERHLSQRNFETWLEWAVQADMSPVSVLSADIGKFPRGLRCDEAAFLLKAVDRLSPIASVSNMERPTLSFVSVGTYQIEEALLAGAIASGLGHHAVCDVLPGARPVPNIATEFSGLLSLDTSKENSGSSVNEEARAGQFLFVHPLDSFRNLVAKAVSLSGTDDPGWRAAAELLAVPLRTNRRIAVIDVKVGDQPPALSYMRGMDLARALLKVAWLARIECRVLLTDAARSSSLAFGSIAVAAAIRRAVEGACDLPYADIAIELAAQSLSMLMPGASVIECEQRARQVLDGGFAWNAVDLWRLPAFQFGNQAGSNRTPRDACIVKAPRSGYFTSINEPLVRLALRGPSHTQFSGMQEIIGALILKPLGTAVGIADDFIEVFGELEAGALERVRAAILQACAITDTPLPASSIIRVLMMLEAVLLRKQKTIVVPVKWLGDAGFAAYMATVPGQFPHSLLTLPDEQDHDPETALVAARQLVRELLPGYAVLSIVHDLKITSDVVIYEPDIDGLVRPQYSIIKASVMSVWSTSEAGLSSDAPSGSWLTLRDVASHDASSMLESERTMYDVIRQVLESYS